MTGDGFPRDVVGYCFVLREGRSYVGCVSVQHDEFHGTARAEATIVSPERSGR